MLAGCSQSETESESENPAGERTSDVIRTTGAGVLNGIKTDAQLISCRCRRIRCNATIEVRPHVYRQCCFTLSCYTAACVIGVKAFVLTRRTLILETNVWFLS